MKSSSVEPSRMGRITHNTKVMMLGLCLGIAMRLLLVGAKPNLSHDEAITFLAVSAKQGAYAAVIEETTPPYGRLVRASEWQAFVQPSKPAAPSVVARDLGKRDIHPPLYFLLLHLSASILGLSTWLAAGFNSLLAGLTGLLIYRSGRALQLTKDESTAAAWLYWLSPACITTAATARPYELLAFLTALMCCQLVAARSSATTRPWLHAISVAPIAFLAGLTHHQFVVAVGSVVLLLTLTNRSRLRLHAALGTSIITGLGASWLVQPYFARQLARQAEQAQPFELAGALKRLFMFGVRLFDLFGMRELKIVVVCGISVAALALYRTTDARSRKRNFRRLQLKLQRLTPVLALLTLLTLGLLASYVSFRTPAAALGGRYFALLWPLLVLPVAAGAACWLSRRALQRCSWLLVFVSALGPAEAYFKRSPTLDFQTLDAVVVDSVARGILPRIARALPPSTLVLATSQAALATSTTDWLKPNLGEHIAYVSNPYYLNSAAQKEQILAALKTRYKLTEPQPFNGLGSVYFGRQRSDL